MVPVFVTCSVASAGIELAVSPSNTRPQPSETLTMVDTLYEPDCRCAPARSAPSVVMSCSVTVVVSSAPPQPASVNADDRKTK